MSGSIEEDSNHADRSLNKNNVILGSLSTEFNQTLSSESRLALKLHSSGDWH